MANFFFDGYRNNVLGNGTRIDLDTDTIRTGGIDHADDTPVVADVSIADLIAAGRVPATFTSWPALASRTIGVVGVGVFDAADTVFTALTGDQFESLIIAKDTGTESTSLLVNRWDTATGLPFTPSGADMTVTWAAGGIVTA